MSYLGRKSGRAALTISDIPDNSITSAKIVAGTVAASDLADNYDDVIQTNIALLAFKTATNGSLAKYNLQDQVIDEYTDATGVDATPSTNHILASGVYSGVSFTTGATGGTIVVPGSYTGGTYQSNTFTSSGTFTVPAGLTSVDYLIVGGGGGGGKASGGGGGGAGGFRTATSLTVSAQAYSIVVGTGGAGATGYDGQGINGVSSSFNSITSTGGGGGGSEEAGEKDGENGASGGGGGRSDGTGGTSTAYGNNGGNAADLAGGGGGGATGAGVNGNASGAVAGAGGAGTANSYRTGSPATYAGGGGGGSGSSGTLGAGGLGGGGTGGKKCTSSPTAGTDGTGGGGGAALDGNGADGGDGIVVIRYIPATTPADLILQSTDTEAEAQPTKADMVMLVEDAGSGVATLGTHIKGYISRDSGTTFTEGTLVDEGDWGTDKRILAFHDLDISSQPADQTMCYKITTHSSSAVYDTKIHATSIGWR